LTVIGRVVDPREPSEEGSADSIQEDVSMSELVANVCFIDDEDEYLVDAVEFLWCADHLLKEMDAYCLHHHLRLLDGLAPEVFKLRQRVQAASRSLKNSKPSIVTGKLDSIN
jgi:hypothetical protein